MTFHQLHIEEVALPSLIVQSEPHCGQCGIWLGERELAKEVAFIFLFFFVAILSKAHFMMSRGLLFTLFVEAISFCL